MLHKHEYLVGTAKNKMQSPIRVRKKKTQDMSCGTISSIVIHRQVESLKAEGMMVQKNAGRNNGRQISRFDENYKIYSIETGG